jgi:hypothetical protein
LLLQYRGQGEGESDVYVASLPEHPAGNGRPRAAGAGQQCQRDVRTDLIVAQAANARRARERGLTYFPTTPGDHISGRLTEVANLVSGRFAVIDHGLGFQLVPWQPVVDKRIGQHITGSNATTAALSGPLEETEGLSL